MVNPKDCAFQIILSKWTEWQFLHNGCSFEINGAFVQRSSGFFVQSKDLLIFRCNYLYYFYDNTCYFISKFKIKKDSQNFTCQIGTIITYRGMPHKLQILHHLSPLIPCMEHLLKHHQQQGCGPVKRCNTFSTINMHLDIVEFKEGIINQEGK